MSEGELLTIVGPNDAGKSTLLRLLIGHLAPTGGSIRRRPGLTMAYVPQQFKVPPDLPITMRRFLSDIGGAARAEVLATLEIAELLKAPLQTLSGGETQRLLLARAMLLNSDLIALDEPASGIDPASLGNYYQTIREYQVQRGCTIVMVSHDLHLVGIMVQFLGIMLIISFLILPVQTANPLSKKPEQCVLLACLFSALATTLGVWSAYRWDLPVSPAIVAFLGFSYLMIHLFRFLLYLRRRF